ncbi:MAG: undecaprenyl-diphosphate phosphatase [Firmicutes bacterium]|nr:undecaprenyl-diphosphate phosphatase [Bacillota bacterium]
MTMLEALFLGIVQGLTEFLPVSSSGHLVLFSHLLGVKEPSLVFETVVHGGTLVAVLIVLRKDVSLLAESFLKIIRKPSEIGRHLAADPGSYLFFSVVLATLPVAVLALVFKGWIERLFLSSVLVGFMLLVTGTVLFVTDRLRPRLKKMAELSVWDLLIIGDGQAAAILPGISRSGTTIGAGLALGLRREDAARFSFLLSIPAILGALIFAGKDLLAGSTALPAGPLLVGFASSAFTGYLAIRLLLNLIKQGRLIWFSYYTWVVGVVVIILNIF